MAGKLRQDRLKDVCEVVWAADGVGVTRGDVARALGLKLSPYIIDLLDDLVAAGWVTKVWVGDTYPAGYRYYPVLEKQAREV
jgi:hypothetical protein